jgi:hypothetical protein
MNKSRHSSIQPVKSDAIIVLGTEVQGYQPSLALHELLDWALALYCKHYAPAIILLGGQGGPIIEGKLVGDIWRAKVYLTQSMYLDKQSHKYLGKSIRGKTDHAEAWNAYSNHCVK